MTKTPLTVTAEQIKAATDRGVDVLRMMENAATSAIADEEGRKLAFLGADSMTMQSTAQAGPQALVGAATAPLNPTMTRDGYELPGFEAQVRLRRIPESDHEMLGRAVREVWVAWARTQPNPKPHWLVPWEGLDAPDREVDVLIGCKLANIGRLRYVDFPTIAPEQTSGAPVPSAPTSGATGHDEWASRRMRGIRDLLPGEWSQPGAVLLTWQTCPECANRQMATLGTDARWRCSACACPVEATIQIGAAAPPAPEGALTFDQAKAACANMGINLDCGSCAAQFYTGFGGYDHDATCTRATVEAEAGIHGDLRTCPTCEGQWVLTTDAGIRGETCPYCALTAPEGGK